MSGVVIDAVRSKYGAVAESGLSSDKDSVRAVAEAFGYTSEELSSIPAEANMGLSCGNPTAMAHLKPGEVVVDLGSGGGLDVFLAAQKVGPTGKAIGSVDCVISNCVINLAPDKDAVFREVSRVLRPGGRLAVSDIALKQPLPEEVGSDLMAYIGCVAGAISIEEYKRGLLDAGFAHVEIIDSKADLTAFVKVGDQLACRALTTTGPKELPIAASGRCGPEETEDGDLYRVLADLLRRYNINDYAASVKVFAVKP